MCGHIVARVQHVRASPKHRCSTSKSAAQEIFKLTTTPRANMAKKLFSDRTRELGVGVIELGFLKNGDKWWSSLKTFTG